MLDVETKNKSAQLTDISEILTYWKELSTSKKELEQVEDMLRDKIKIYLKERKWDKYNDNNTKISVSLSVQKRITFDEKQLSSMLSPSQLAQASKVTTFEKLMIITEENKEKMKSFMTGKKSKLKL